MKINTPRFVSTHEGGKAVEANPYERLRRTVLACLLFEDNFYEDGIKAVDRIKELCSQVHVAQIIELAEQASDKYKLRHVPLLLIVEALKHRFKSLIWPVIADICSRPDMMTDLLALYWKDGKKPLPNQLKKGLSVAFTRFDEYQLSKYNRDNAIKLRDVLFMTHPKPKDDAQADLWKRLVDGKLKVADTWETRLSAGEDKKESFQELLEAGKMGKLAILRNLRNMHDAGVPKKLVAAELIKNMKEMLPFQYLAAARECPQWEDIVDSAMIQAASLKEKLPGKTIILVDVSGSMSYPLSSKSKMTRMDAACGLAILLREVCDEGEIYSFSDQIMPVAPRQGMALRDAIVNSQQHSGTALWQAVKQISQNCTYDRIILITDEQAQDNYCPVKGNKNYILNIGSYANGIGRKKYWTTITGFSEASIDFIRELENFN